MDRRAYIFAWSALAFMAIAAGVAWIWETFPRGDPLGATAAAWVQAWGTIAAILASSAIAIGVPLMLDRLRVRRYRRAWVALIESTAEDMSASMFWVETGGQEQTKYVPSTYSAREQQLASFPLHELDDPKVLNDSAWARQALLILVDEVRAELHRPRYVWERLRSLQHNVWQTGEWAKARYGWPEKPNPGPHRAFGGDSNLARSLEWDDDGNPLLRPRGHE